MSAVFLHTSLSVTKARWSQATDLSCSVNPGKAPREARAAFWGEKNEELQVTGWTQAGTQKQSNCASTQAT